MTLYMDGVGRFLDYRETAPNNASPDMYLDREGNVDTDASKLGHRAVGVPGTVAGLWEAHQAYGRVPWAELLAPAVALARDGFVVSPALAEEAETLQPRFQATNFSAYFGALEAGKTFHQPELAEPLERIAHEGPGEFYRGHTAALIVAEMNRGGGLVKAADLVGYRPIWREPIVFDWRGYRVLSAPLPSSGGFAIAQFLKLYDLRRADFAGLPHDSAGYIHLKAEIEKRIFADRARYLGDPDFVDVPMARLLGDEYLASRASGIDPGRISSPESVQPPAEGMHTTHFSILDGAGNAVSNTFTLNTSFGSGVVVTGGGFLLNNEMDDFAVAPDVPNYFGVVGNRANAIEPGKRMLSSMSPTIALRGDAVAMVVGAMGGPAIFTTIYQVMLNLETFGMTAAEAVAATRVHHQLLPPDLITYMADDLLPETTVAQLRGMGYRVEPHFSRFGDVQLIWVTGEGELQAASDPRFSGKSAVLELPDT
jgi:gamma-glutamyltranspeptidase/glutathione hydrolase